MISSVPAAIDQHRKAISEAIRYFHRCSRCEATSGFTRHEARRRQVRVIVDGTVQVFWIVVIRWKCSRCALVVTDLPDFLLPYRRYASTSLLPLARDYLERDALSYEGSVAPQGRVRGYVTPSDQEKIDERALNRGTLWRFLLFLGTQTVALRHGLEIWSEHDPLSRLHRFLGPVAPHKYRSSQRAETLRTARRLLHLIDHWNQTFDQPFFPHFATNPRAP